MINKRNQKYLRAMVKSMNKKRCVIKGEPNDKYRINKGYA